MVVIMMMTKMIIMILHQQPGLEGLMSMLVYLRT